MVEERRISYSIPKVGRMLQVLLREGAEYVVETPLQYLEPELFRHLTPEHSGHPRWWTLEFGIDADTLSIYPPPVKKYGLRYVYYPPEQEKCFDMDGEALERASWTEKKI